jgi:hypothetical protein
MLLFLSLLCCVVLSIPGEGLMSVLLFFFFHLLCFLLVCFVSLLLLIFKVVQSIYLFPENMTFHVVEMFVLYRQGFFLSF